MKRLLPLAPLTLLLLFTMGVGPCDSKPLGSVDGCTYNGKTYASGMSFPAADGCNTCSCQDGKAACSLLACTDGGTGPCFDNKGNTISCSGPDGGTDGSPATDAGGHCFDLKGNEIPCGNDGGTGCTYNGKSYPLGSSFTCSDGCNTCSCTSNGVAGTTKGCPDAGSDGAVTCFDMNGKMIPCANDGGVQCLYGTKVYAVGASFPSSDGCNTCSCTAGGMIACTEKACYDGSLPDGTDGAMGCFDANGKTVPCADGGQVGVCMPGADQGCNEDPRLNVILGKCRPDYTCDCGMNTLDPTTGLCVPAGTPTGCAYDGSTFPVGSKFMCPTIDNGCNQGVCFCAMPGVTTPLCPGQTPPVCGFDAAYVYGQTGGLVAYTDQVTLTPPASYVLVRTANASTVAGGSCGPALPACDSAFIDVSDIMRDIADPTVQLLLSLSTMQPTLLGVDSRPVDGTVFSFKKNGTAGFLVGSPCNGASNCTAIPGAVTSLMSDLQKLDSQQQQDPSCAAFLKKM